MAAEDVVIVPYRDGPYLVRGPLVLRDQDGEEIELTRRTVALCRCGKSRMRPFCDGTHRLVRFRAPSTPERPSPPSAEGQPQSAEAPALRTPEPPRGPGASKGGPPGSAPASAPAGLRRARDRIARLLEDGPSGRPHLALRAALPLLDGAYRLLEDRRPGPPQPPTAALYLVMGAFDALGAAAELREPALAAAASELAAVAVALEPRCNEAWRP
jgi:CDGSH-type Zn-finger protein